MVKRVKAPFDPADYSIAVKRNRKPGNSWRWDWEGHSSSTISQPL